MLYEFLDSVGNKKAVVYTEDPEQTLSELAKSHGVTSYEIYDKEQAAFESLKSHMLYMVNQTVSNNITSGFDCLVSSATLDSGAVIENKTVRFDCEEHDQNNFVKQQVAALSGLVEGTLPIRGVIDGTGLKQEMTVSLDVYRYILAIMSVHITTNTQKGWKVKALIEPTTTKEELDAIDWQKLLSEGGESDGEEIAE